MAANHQENYTMNVNIQTLCNIIRSQGFAEQLRTELKSENPTPTGVWFRLHHGATFTSWGEKITITLTPCGANATQVTIHSECGMPTQVIDWGKNKQIVCNVYEYLAANVENQPLAQPRETAFVPPAANFCSRCGTPVAGANANFCRNCGAKLR